MAEADDDNFASLLYNFLQNQYIFLLPHHRNRRDDCVSAYVAVFTERQTTNRDTPPCYVSLSLVCCLSGFRELGSDRAEAVIGKPLFNLPRTRTVAARRLSPTTRTVTGDPTTTCLGRSTAPHRGQLVAPVARPKTRVEQVYRKSERRGRAGHGRLGRDGEMGGREPRVLVAHVGVGGGGKAARHDSPHHRTECVGRLRRSESISSSQASPLLIYIPNRSGFPASRDPSVHGSLHAVRSPHPEREPVLAYDSHEELQRDDEPLQREGERRGSAVGQEDRREAQQGVVCPGNQHQFGRRLATKACGRYASSSLTLNPSSHSANPAPLLSSLAVCK